MNRRDPIHDYDVWFKRYERRRAIAYWGTAVAGGVLLSAVIFVLMWLFLIVFGS